MVVTELSSSYFWPGINRDVRHFTCDCLACQQAKVQRLTKTTPGTFRPPGDRFTTLHVDLVGLLPPCNGFKYLLTCVDHYTCWPEANPLPDSVTTTVAQAFLLHWVARFGIATTIVSDSGAQFESASWSSLMELLGCSCQQTTSYHPASDGMVERFHRHLKGALMAHGCDHTAAQWLTALPVVLLGIRSALKADLDCTSAELVLGTTL